jgi:hypothetical protein
VPPSAIAGTRADMRIVRPIMTVKMYIHDVLYRMDSTVPKGAEGELHKLWDDIETMPPEVMAACFPGLQEIIAEAGRRGGSPKAAELFRLYRQWMFVQFCNQVSEGYAMVYVNDVELERARAAVRAIEKKILAENPGVDSDKVWNEAAKPVRFPANPDQCKRNVVELLNANPRGAFEVERP